VEEALLTTLIMLGCYSEQTQRKILQISEPTLALVYNAIMADETAVKTTAAIRGETVRNIQKVSAHNGPSRDHHFNKNPQQNFKNFKSQIIGVSLEISSKFHKSKFIAIAAAQKDNMQVMMIARPSMSTATSVEQKGT
jgi:hypothetical protein